MANILIVDDDRHVAQMFATLLQHERHDVHFADSAGAALSHLRQSEPDLILLDLGMPRVDGLDLLEALGDEPRFAHIPVIVLTGRTEPEALARARRLGAADYLVKGADWSTLYPRIQAHLPHAAAAS